MNNQATPQKVYIIDELFIRIEEAEVEKITEKVYHLMTEKGIRQVKKKNVYLEFGLAKNEVLKRLEVEKKRFLNHIKDIEEKVGYISTSSSFDEMTQKKRAIIFKK